MKIAVILMALADFVCFAFFESKESLPIPYQISAMTRRVMVGFMFAEAFK